MREDLHAQSFVVDDDRVIFIGDLGPGICEGRCGECGGERASARDTRRSLTSACKAFVWWATARAPCCGTQLGVAVNTNVRWAWMRIPRWQGGDITEARLGLRLQIC